MSYDSQILADGAVFYWPTTDASGDLVDLVAAKHAVPNSAGSTYRQTGADGVTACAVSIGASTVFQAANAANFAQTVWTMEAWFNGTGANKALINWGRGGYEIMIDATGKLFLQNILFGGGITAAGAAVNDGLWHYAAATWNGTTAVMYRDGLQINTGTADQLGGSGNFSGTHAQSFDAGALDNGGYGNFWGSRISRYAIYPTALSAATIANHYTLGLLAPAAAPQFLQQLDPLNASRSFA